MTATKRNDIAEDVCTAIRSMTIAGGYTFDVKTSSVFRDPMNLLLPDLPPGNMPLYWVEIDHNEERIYQRSNRVRVILPLTVTFRATAQGAKTDFARKSKTFEAMVGDLERVLNVDITRGGRVIDTKLGAATPYMSLAADDIVIGVQPITCEYIRTVGAP